MKLLFPTDLYNYYNYYNSWVEKNQIFSLEKEKQWN